MSLSPAGSPTNGPTRFAELNRLQAWIILGTFMLFMAWCLATALSPKPAASKEGGGNDLELYRAIVERIRGGEGYYDVAAVELRQRGYPTRSVFNWRPPLYAWFFGSLPRPVWGQVLLNLLALATIVMAFTLVGRQGGPLTGVLVVLILVNTFAWGLIDDVFLVTELWASVLIALSICLYARERPIQGAVIGLLAVFIRELALPYALVAGGLALRQRRWHEAGLWIGGLLLYGAYLAYHVSQVVPRIREDDLAQHSGWVQFGGLPFLLSTCKMNAFLRDAPLWLAAVYLPLCFLGLLGWRGPMAERTRLTVGLYLIAFAVVGKPMNFYWGLLYVPLLGFGLAWSPLALADVVRQLRGSATPPTIPSVRA